MKFIKSEVCTLFEGSYHVGVAALINSLCAFNYKGNIWIGYRGKLPPWIEQFNSKELIDYLVVDIYPEVKANFVYLETDIHFTNYKPQFIEIVKKLCSNQIKYIFYFDPDIIINQNWAFFENWASYGLAICQDPNLSFSENHPIRKRREDLVLALGYNLNHKLSAYYNAGFIGVPMSKYDFSTLWTELFEVMVKNRIVDLQPGWNNKNKIGVDYFSGTEDQDIFNVALSIYEGGLSDLGPDGMGFHHGFSAMAHFTGRPKPWNRRHLYELILNGIRPSRWQLVFMRYLSKPIKIYPHWRISLKTIDLLFARALSRIIG